MADISRIPSRGEPEMPHILRQWDLAWAEFRQEHPLMERVRSGVAFWLFTGLGLALVPVILTLTLPWFVVAIELLGFVALMAIFVIHFRGKAYDRVVEALRERLRPKLSIDFDDTDLGCVSRQHDQAVTQYRIRVLSPADVTGVEFVVNHLTLLDFPFIDYHLRPLNDRDKKNGTKRVNMRGGKWYYWDLITVFDAKVMQSGKASVTFDFIPALGGSFKAEPGFYQFELMASGETSPVATKIAAVTIANNGKITIDLADGRLSPTS